MRKIYIAGPMTGLPEFNFPAFHDAAARLREEGWDVVNPAEGVSDTSRSWGYFMRRALGLLLQCDAIYLLKGWSESQGALLEHHVAHKLGMELYVEGFKEPRPLQTEGKNEGV